MIKKILIKFNQKLVQKDQVKMEKK